MKSRTLWDIEIQTFFRWYDLWVGFYYDRKQKRLYFLPIPMCGVWIEVRKSTQ